MTVWIRVLHEASTRDSSWSSFSRGSIYSSQFRYRRQRKGIARFVNTFLFSFRALRIGLALFLTDPNPGFTAPKSVLQTNQPKRAEPELMDVLMASPSPEVLVPGGCAVSAEKVPIETARRSLCALRSETLARQR